PRGEPLGVLPASPAGLPGPTESGGDRTAATFRVFSINPSYTPSHQGHRPRAAPPVSRPLRGLLTGRANAGLQDDPCNQWDGPRRGRTRVVGREQAGHPIAARRAAPTTASKGAR